MKQFILLISILLFTFSSCKNNADQQHSDQEQATEHNSHEGHDHANEATKEDVKVDNSKLHLNNGKKWTVNDATHVGMKNIKELLIDYVKNDKTDHLALGTSMAAETTTIITKCDMVGPDHDQLHLILVPILESIDEIKKTKSAEPVMNLSVHLSEYFKHFQLAK